MAAEKIVIDASIIAKCFLEEKYSDKASKLMDAHTSGRFRLVAPSLIVYEVLNALKRSNIYTKEELTLVSQSINKYDFELWDLEEGLKEEVIKIAVGYGLSVYDASYIALARVLNTTFFTADEELVRRTKDLKLTKHVREV
ncbi:MAG: Ribonuclease VapC3 [Candidatus Bathyarchaeota archaeon BA2]|nr:MAG: Ribonuclease VapC3 [Candidatus Bathyarchaeota archaeon BA2]